MTIPLSEALDEAQLVKTRGAGLVTRLAVWHGGHTVNMYETVYDTDTRDELYAVSSASVGDLRTGEVPESEVREAMEDLLPPNPQAEPTE
jgi:hypothetical protein